MQCRNEEYEIGLNENSMDSYSFNRENLNIYHISLTREQFGYYICEVIYRKQPSER